MAKKKAKKKKAKKKAKKKVTRKKAKKAKKKKKQCSNLTKVPVLGFVRRQTKWELGRSSKFEMKYCGMLKKMEGSHF